MWVIPKDGKLPGNLRYALEKKIRESRFTAQLEVRMYSRSQEGVKITLVRLRRGKSYCGQHPGPCLVDNRPHKKYKYLEGLDWVGFNHLVNDVLDDMDADANVFSANREAQPGVGRYFIRDRRRRRIDYPYETTMVSRGDYGGAWQVVGWSQGSFKDDFEDHCGKPSPAIPAHVVDAGTPGYPCYTAAEEDQYRAEEEDHH